MSSEEEPAAWLRKTIEGDKARVEGMAALLGAGWSTRRNDSDGFDYTVYGTDPDEPVADTWRADVASWLADNDPQDVIARCEAELAILDEHRLVVADRGLPEQGQSRGTGYRVIWGNPTETQIQDAPMMWRNLDCAACRRMFPCRTVRLLADGYRHRPGYPAAFAADLHAR
jgi:Family of unknown function (DUF6221)